MPVGRMNEARREADEDEDGQISARQVVSFGGLANTSNEISLEITCEAAS